MFMIREVLNINPHGNLKLKPLCARDAEVFAGAGWTWMRTQAAVSDGVAKVNDGALRI